MIVWLEGIIMLVPSILECAEWRWAWCVPACSIRACLDFMLYHPLQTTAWRRAGLPRVSVWPTIYCPQLLVLWRVGSRFRFYSKWMPRFTRAVRAAALALPPHTTRIPHTTPARYHRALHARTHTHAHCHAHLLHRALHRTHHYTHTHALRCPPPPPPARVRCGFSGWRQWIMVVGRRTDVKWTVKWYSGELIDHYCAGRWWGECWCDVLEQYPSGEGVEVTVVYDYCRHTSMPGGQGERKKMALKCNLQYNKYK